MQAMDTLILRALEAMNERAPSSLMLDLVPGVTDGAGGDVRLDNRGLTGEKDARRI